MSGKVKLERNAKKVQGGGKNFGKEEYKREIVRMVEGIEDEKILKLIYGFTKSGYREERAGRK